MTEIIVPINGGMFDSTEVVETVNGFPRGNKAVNAAFFAKMISCFYKDGLFGENSFVPSAAGGMTVKIGGGIGWINGYMAWQENDTLITLQPGGVYAIVLRLDTAAGQFSIIAGNMNGDFPQKSENIVDLTLAEVTVQSTVTAVTDEMIRDTRGDSAKCGFVTSAIDALSTVETAQNANTLGGILPDEFMKKSGGTMSGRLRAAADTSGISAVRNIGYGTSLPSSLENGDLFILLS